MRCNRCGLGLQRSGIILIHRVNSIESGFGLLENVCILAFAIRLDPTSGT